MDCFEDFSKYYELMITWPQRIKREGAFFKSLFARYQVSSVLDAGCGTGNHAIEFGKWGMAVTGCDISPNMIERAQLNARKAGVTVHFEVAAFHEMRAKLPGTFDAVICIGNNLALVLDEAELRLSLQNMYEMLSPGGICTLQLQNYDRILDKKQQFLPLKTTTQGDKEFLFFRMLEFHEEPLSFHIIVFEKTPPGTWAYFVNTTKLQPWRKNQLEPCLKDAGFQQIEFYGSYSFESYAATISTDLVIVAHP